jgi:hypothetical protein
MNEESQALNQLVEVVGGLCKFLGLVVSQSKKVLCICIAYLSLADMDTSWTHHGHTLILALS